MEKANLGFPEFLVLYALRKSANTWYYFQNRFALQSSIYITNLLGQDKDRYKDILLVEGDWEGDIYRPRVPLKPESNVKWRTEIQDLESCRPKLIDRAFQFISTIHRS